ncbi:MAG: hypothetical protein QM778_11380 [Myxococcales bacterium]
MNQRRESMTYVGLGSISQPEGLNPYAKPAIFVLNQEIYERLQEHWVGSLALSYRRQNLYRDEPPYTAAELSVRHELRFYGRLSGSWQAGRLKLVSTARPELRVFFAGGEPAAEPLQFRFRLREQAGMRLDRADVHRLVGSAEVLASISKRRGDDGAWSALEYQESRFCLYYAWHGKGRPLAFDVGYMNDLMGHGGARADAHYFALDVVWTNPFGSPRRR